MLTFLVGWGVFQLSSSTGQDINKVAEVTFATVLLICNVVMLNRD